MLQEEEERRVRRDDYKERPTVDKDNSRLLVQTLNGLVRGTTKSALGETVDVFLGVMSNKILFLIIRISMTMTNGNFHFLKFCSVYGI